MGAEMCVLFGPQGLGLSYIMSVFATRCLWPHLAVSPLPCSLCIWHGSVSPFHCLGLRVCPSFPLSLSLAARDALTQKANTLLLKKLGIRKRFNPSIAPPSSNFDLPETSLSLATESRCWEPGADAYCAQRYRGGRQSRRTQRFTVRSTARWPLDIMFAAPVYARARVC